MSYILESMKQQLNWIFKAWRSFAALFLSTLLSSASAAAFSTQVELAQGTLLGVSTPVPGVEAFKGIPYAQPPVGENRWKPAQPPTNWLDFRQADRFGPDCVQSSTMIKVEKPESDTFFQPPSLTSEDCLYLNIWRPTERAEKLAVMVWIHGGGSVQGSGAQPLYDGARLAQKGVIVVTLNYRLGIFGRFSHPELSLESATQTSGNYDLSDILQALRWIKENISRFGGDPERITAFGESSGGAYVSALTIMPAARGLFHQAIVQSGSIFYRSYPTLAEAETSGVEFGKTIKQTTLRDLRTVPADQMQTLSRSLSFSPTLVVDGQLIRKQPCEALMRGEMAEVPLIAGSNGAELFGFGLFDGVDGASSYERRIKQVYGSDAELILHTYPARRWRESIKQQQAYGLSAAMAENITRHATAQAYLYYFNHSVDGVSPAFHTAEIPFVFNNPSSTARYSKNLPAPQANTSNSSMAETMSNYWVAFARTGSPQVKGQPEWPSNMQSKAGAYLEFHDAIASARVKYPLPARVDLCARFINDQSAN